MLIERNNGEEQISVESLFAGYSVTVATTCVCVHTAFVASAIIYHG